MVPTRDERSEENPIFYFGHCEEMTLSKFHRKDCDGILMMGRLRLLRNFIPGLYVVFYCEKIPGNATFLHAVLGFLGVNLEDPADFQLGGRRRQCRYCVRHLPFARVVSI